MSILFAVVTIMVALMQICNENYCAAFWALAPVVILFVAILAYGQARFILTGATIGAAVIAGCWASYAHHWSSFTFIWGVVITLVLASEAHNAWRCHRRGWAYMDVWPARMLRR